MTWKKFFKPVNSVLPVAQRAVDSTSAYASTSKYSNWLPEVYSGPPDRLQRYSVYDQMDFDHEIHAALDTIADFGTEPDMVTQLPLVLKYNDAPFSIPPHRQHHSYLLHIRRRLHRTYRHYRIVSHHSLEYNQLLIDP